MTKQCVCASDARVGLAYRCCDFADVKKKNITLLGITIAPELKEI